MLSLVADLSWSKDLLGFSNYSAIKDRPMELAAALRGVSLLPGQSQTDLADRLSLPSYAESEQQIILEGVSTRIVLKVNEKGIYETSIESSDLGLIKESIDFDESELSVTIFGQDLFYAPLSVVLQKWGLPDFYEKIGEVMYSMAANKMVILGYNIYGLIDRVSVIDGSFD